MILPYRDKQPLIEESAYVSSNATVIGDVTLEKGSSMGNWLFFGEDDPNFYLREIPEGAKKLRVELAVYPLETGAKKELGQLAELSASRGEEIRKLREQLRQAENTISEMKHTKVWKAYEKYRGYREQHQK